MNPFRYLRSKKRDINISRLEYELGIEDINEGYYDVRTNPGTKGISVSICHGFSGYCYHVVYPPNILECLFGISYEKKLKNALEKTRIKCEKMNMEYESIQKTCDCVYK